MRSWTSRANRGATLALLLLIPGVLGGTGLRPAVPLPAAAIAPGFESDELDDLNDTIAARTAKPAPLILAELSPKNAPVPSGPVTYVPILYYHYIRINPNPRDRVGFSLSTPPAMFRAQMQYLADHGFHVISLHQAVVAIKNHSGLPSRPVVLTFDDGYADFFTTAVPILQSHGFTATSFVISGRMGWYGYMTPSQVVAAYPYGSFNQYDMAQAKSLGFETAASTMYGTAHSAGQLFLLSRMRIGGGLPLTYFAGVVVGPSPTSAELRTAGGSPTTSPAPSAAPQPSPSPTPIPSPSATASALSAPLSLYL